MLNFADFSTLLMAFIGPVSGVCAAHAHKAGVPALVVFGVGGLGVGIFLGMAANKCAYRVLDSKRLTTASALFGYMAIPLIGILVVVLVPFLVAEIVYGHT